MNNAFAYQFILNLSLASGKYKLPRSLRRVVKEINIINFEEMREVLVKDLEVASLQSKKDVNFFWFLSRVTVQYFTLSHDYTALTSALKAIHQKIGVLKSIPDTGIQFEPKEQYFNFSLTCLLRIIRHITVEQFEEQIEDLPWDSFDKGAIAELSSLIGAVYLEEEDTNLYRKSRFWFHKALAEGGIENNLGNYIFYAEYYFKEKGANSIKKTEDIVASLDQVAKASEDEYIRMVYGFAAHELQGKLLSKQFDKFEKSSEGVSEAAKMLEPYKERHTEDYSGYGIPSFLQSSVSHSISQAYKWLHDIGTEITNRDHFRNQAETYLTQAISIANESRYERQEMSYRIDRALMSLEYGTAVTEKECKEISQHFKKAENYVCYMDSVGLYLRQLQTSNVSKAHDVVLDIFKAANKRLDKGGFYLIVRSFNEINRVFKDECSKPGISWVVQILDDFFGKIKEIIDELPKIVDPIGLYLINRFRAEYSSFEEVSHYNIRVYFSYQYYAIKMLRIGNIAMQDEVGAAMADNILMELEKRSNPLNFMQADWDDFKKVPNQVRNDTLNKCISITKGDLPKAAEHLDFSYRNLRSYITFNEVNRLGFFLDLIQTDNRQLEKGIRYMFYDLYKKGTIFEVVFDMPKFLVSHQKDGFFSQDLEKELHIKGTTAKKYIKIMTEIGLIKQGKTKGRKHFYTLIVENIMKRLGEEQSMLIKS